MDFTMKTSMLLCTTWIIVCCQNLAMVASMELPMQNNVSNRTVKEKLNLEERIEQLESLVLELKTSCESRKEPKDYESVIQPQGLRVARQVEGFIGFTSYLDHNIGHMGIGQTIIYDKVLLNEGNAYSPATGHFTCPLDGYYVFSYTVYTNNIHQVVARLVVDGVNMLDGISDTFHETHEAQGGNFAVLHLKTGQMVSIQNYRWVDKEIDGSNENRMSSFSGYLIHYE